MRECKTPETSVYFGFFVAGAYSETTSDGGYFRLRAALMMAADSVSGSTHQSPSVPIVGQLVSEAPCSVS